MTKCDMRGIGRVKKQIFGVTYFSHGPSLLSRNKDVRMNHLLEDFTDYIQN